MGDRLRTGSANRAYRLHRAGDVLLLVLASLVAAVQGGTLRWETAAVLIASATALWMLAARVLHQYDPGSGRGFFDDVALTLVMIAAVSIPIAAASRAAPGWLSTEQAGRFALVLLPTVLLLRSRGIGLRLWHATPAVDVLIAGTGPLGRISGEQIDTSEGAPTRSVLGYLAFDDARPHSRLPAPVLGNLDALEATLREHVVDEVYFASTEAEHHLQMQAGIRVCEKLGVPFALPVCPYRLTRATVVTPSSDGYLHFLSVKVKPLQLAMKRVFDMLSSGLALFVLSPLLLATAIAIRATSAGPVLFKQQRVGLHGRRFNMLKFRSMVVDAEALKAQLLSQNEQTGPVFKMKRDPRVTAVGRFIRKYSIDELPQLVNILRGDMSVVGPRPPLPGEVAKYEGWQCRRLSVRPGLTCVWQVSGRNQISFDDWMLMDMRYIDHWSLFGDFDLIWRTIPVVLLARGAS